MRAKRSKKYRRLMSAYSLSFSFHPPYQVLLDSHFLKQCHRFHMPVRLFLEKTLQGEVRGMVTECTLAKIMGEAQAGETRGRARRPEFLPPPTELPLRYCKHEGQREETGSNWTEVDCLVDLLGGMARGGEQKKNKWHYILATADAEEEVGKRVRGPDVRDQARKIPGVPIVYVKRSVMILEELSGASERFIRGREKEKLREGILGNKRKLTADEEEDEEDGGPQSLSKTPRGMKKAKGPNPLSVLKKKAKISEQDGDAADAALDGNAAPKAKRRRKHGSKNADLSAPEAVAAAA